MTCAVCSASVQPIAHHFHCDAPKREGWTVMAPLYYAASADFRSMVAPFCGAACSTAYVAAGGSVG